MVIRSEQAGCIKEGIKTIFKSEDTNKITNNAIELVLILENNNNFFRQVEGMKPYYTREHILTEINNMGLKQLCATTVGNYNFSEIDTPIPVVEKCERAGKTLREYLIQ